MKVGVWYKKHYWLTIILLMAAALRFYHIDYQSLWLDEVLSMNDANPNLTFKQFYDSVLFWESFPHLYFLLLKYSLVIFGDTTFVARMLSAVIGIFGVYAMYLLGKEIYNKRVGLMAAALTTLNFYQLLFSQEARSYGLFFLFTVLAFYRLSAFIKKPTYKNAIFYGIFAGLTINSHFFGFTALFAQYLILLFFLIKTPGQQRKLFFISCFFSGMVTLLFVWPTYDAIMQLGKITSFWVPEPTWDTVFIIIKDFFGNSNWILLMITVFAFYYLLSLFKNKQPVQTHSEIIDTKLLYSAIILFPWLLISIAIPLVKSYLDISIMVARYFINIVPVFILMAAIGIDSIQNKAFRQIALGAFIVTSLADIFLVKEYYTAISKTQLRELTNEIRTKNTNNAKIVTHYSWVFPYFFRDNPNQKIEGSTFEEYITGLKNNSTSHKAFWYADANARPYALSATDKAYLEKYFVKKEQLEYYDSWAHYYVPKSKGLSNIGADLDLGMFSHVSFDGQGNLMMFSNSNARSTLFPIRKGKYELVLNGNSQPAHPINNENAHLKVRLNGKIIGDFFMSEIPSGKTHTFPFTIENDQQARIQLIFDNDIAMDGQDRNVVIYSIKIKKK